MKHLVDRLKLLETMEKDLIQRIRKWTAGQRGFVVDIQQTTGLIRDLQSFRLLVRSLQ